MTPHGRMLGGRYALGAMLGAGVGHMYRARDRVLRRTVAVAAGPVPPRGFLASLLGESGSK